jgi:hypothetical protein
VGANSQYIRLHSTLRIFLVALAVLSALVATGLGRQTPATAGTVPSAPVIGGSIRIVADNDFALLAGDESNVTRMILQNDVVWMDQRANATTYQINLNSGETYLYLLAMGGGGGEDIGGLLNEVDITTIASGVNGIQRAVSRTGGSVEGGFLLLDTFFSDWSSVGFSGNNATNVAYGKYAAPIAGIQDALTGATWGDPPARQNGGIGGNITGYSFSVPSARAVMFRFKGTSLGEGFVVAGEKSADVSWVAPTSDGGSALLDYTVTAYNASTNIATGNVCTTLDGTTRSCTVTGLTNGVAYYFKISARNAMGSGPLSLATQSVTPLDVTPPSLTLTSPSANQSVNNTVFTVTGDEDIDCATLSAVADQDFTVVGGTISSITQQSTTKCAIAVSTTIAASSSTAVTLTKASTFSMTDTSGNATTTLVGSPATVTVSIPAPTTTTTSTTTTSTTTTSTTAAPKPTTTVAVDLEIVVRAPVGQVDSTLAPVGQIAIPTVSSVAPGATFPKISPTTVKSTTTTLGITTTTLLIPKSPSAVAPKIPSLDTGEAAVTSRGKKVSTRLTRENNQIVIQAAGITTTINGLSKSGAPVPLNKDGNVPLQGGSRVRVFAEGFKPNSIVEAWLFSTPTWLGNAKVDEKGTFSRIYILPKDVKPGQHRIALKAVTAVGDEISIALGIVIGDGKAARNIAPWLIAIPIGLAMAAAFFLPVALKRRRDEEEETLQTAP